VELVADGRSLAYREHDKEPCVKQAAIVTNKWLEAVLTLAQKRQKVRDAERLASPTVTKRQKQQILEKQAAAASG
jgi:uncharacterized membrane protein affecting hemolysin expression